MGADWELRLVGVPSEQEGSKIVCGGGRSVIGSDLLASSREGESGAACGGLFQMRLREVAQTLAAGLSHK